MSEENDVVNGRAFERHAQTALVLILVALLLWVGQTTQHTSVVVAEMRVELAFLKAYHATPSAEYQEMAKRVDLLEDLVRQIEMRQHNDPNNP